MDNQGNPLGGATVTGKFTGDATGSSDPVVTSSSGMAVFDSYSTKKGKVKFMFCVTDVEHATLGYEPGDNAVDCASK